MGYFSLPFPKVFLFVKPGKLNNLVALSPFRFSRMDNFNVSQLPKVAQVPRGFYPVVSLFYKA